MAFDSRNYKKLEYIQSSGTQFIDTGIIPSSNTAWTIKFAYSGFNNNYNRAFGVQTGVGAILALRSETATGGKYWFEDNGVGGVKRWSTTDIDFLPHTFVINDNGLYTVDGTSMGDNWPAISDSLTQNFGLFRNSGISTGYAIGKLYASECKLNSTGVTVQKLTPAQSRSTCAIGMFDENYGGGSIDLGSLTWTFGQSGSQNYFYAVSPSDAVLADSGVISNLYLDGYTTYSYNHTPNGNLRVGGSNSWGGRIIISDNAYSDATAFKNAMSGKYLYYQTTSQTSWSKPFYGNDGTGVFIAGPELKWEVTKSVIGYKPTSDITGLSTQASSPTPSSPVSITNVGPYELAGLYTGGEVDLGTLTWSYNSQYSYFRATPPNKLVNSINGYNETYGSLILYNSWGNIENGKIGVKADGSADIAIKDTRYTDPVAFQAAMSGKILYYQTSSQSSWIKPYFDKYYANGGIDETRYVGGKIDLGSLAWNYVSPTQSAPNGYFVCYDVPQKASSSTNQFLQGYSYNTTGGVDKSIWGNNSRSLICITDFRFTDAAAFKEAMSGKYLYYQRTSDSSWTAPTVVPANTIVRQIGKKVLTGAETINTYQSTKIWFDISERLSGSAIGLCNYYPIGTSASQNPPFFWPSNGSKSIIMGDGVNWADGPTAKGWFANKYAANESVEIYHVLENQTTESAPLANINSYKSIINYKPNTDLVGNTTQDGTPTPTNPIPLVNNNPYELAKVGNYQDKFYVDGGVNLFDTDASHWSSGTYLTKQIVASDTAAILKIFDKNNSGDISGCYLGWRKAGTPNDIVWLVSNGTFSSTTVSNSRSGGAREELCIYGQGISLTTALSRLENRFNLSATLGTTAPTLYEPYFTGSKIVRQVGKLVLDGTENWNTYTYQSNPNAYYITVSDMIDTSATTSSTLFMNTHLQYSSGLWGNNNIGYAVSTMERMFFRRNTTDTINDFKTWLASNNITVYYPLATPVLETPTLVPVTNYKSTISI